MNLTSTLPLQELFEEVAQVVAEVVEVVGLGPTPLLILRATVAAA
jgi:hypothetical protein